MGDFPSAIIQSVLHAIVCTFLIHCSVFHILEDGAVVFDMYGFILYAHLLCRVSYIVLTCVHILCTICNTAIK